MTTCMSSADLYYNTESYLLFQRARSCGTASATSAAATSTTSSPVCATGSSALTASRSVSRRAPAMTRRPAAPVIVQLEALASTANHVRKKNKKTIFAYAN